MPRSSTDVTTFTTNAPYERRVFVNCSFDDGYVRLLHAVLFAIHDSGFEAHTAVTTNATVNKFRLERIVDLIGGSRLSIHDLSRTKGVRFNMPFECGVAFGAIRFGKQQERDFLFMMKVPYSVKTYISDLDGFDGPAHQNKAELALKEVSKFLRKHDSGVPGDKVMWERFQAFDKKSLRRQALNAGLSLPDIRSIDRIADYFALALQWLKDNPRP